MSCCGFQNSLGREEGKDFFVWVEKEKNRKREIDT